eukprot:scaffold5230_cov120-Isochrysis_galbana.AAC.1
MPHAGLSSGNRRGYLNGFRPAEAVEEPCAAVLGLAFVRPRGAGRLCASLWATDIARGSVLADGWARRTQRSQHRSALAVDSGGGRLSPKWASSCRRRQPKDRDALQ